LNVKPRQLAAASFLDIVAVEPQGNCGAETHRLWDATAANRSTPAAFGLPLTSRHRFEPR
jgi:hypothetical protein